MMEVRRKVYAFWPSILRQRSRGGGINTTCHVLTTSGRVDEGGTLCRSEGSLEPMNISKIDHHRCPEPAPVDADKTQ